jgi:hypothetical protein
MYKQGFSLLGGNLSQLLEDKKYLLFLLRKKPGLILKNCPIRNSSESNLSTVSEQRGLLEGRSQLFSTAGNHIPLPVV